MPISKYSLSRMPAYLAYLKGFPPDTHICISATSVAAGLGLGPVQVRKDLAAVSRKGRPRTGYIRQQLIEDIEYFLGYHRSIDTVLVGAGKLGKALMGYQGFQEYGMNILAAFDINPSEETVTEGVKVYPVSQMTSYCQENKICMGIITVPAQCAQSVANLLIAGGVKAIWNFAPVHLTVPDDVVIQDENMAESLAILSIHLRNQIKGETRIDIPKA